MKHPEKNILSASILMGITGLIFLLWAGYVWRENTPEYLDNVEVYLRWLNNPQNGLVRSKTVNGFSLTVKYLPPDYLACRELADGKEYSAAYKDSIRSIYNQGMSFLLRIAPDEESHSSDIMFWNARNYQEYKERFLNLNFTISEYIALKTDRGKYNPVLSNLENVYGLTPGRNLQFVFVDEQHPNGLKEAAFFDFIFTDEIFDTGINHFVFSREDINNIPKLIF